MRFVHDLRDRNNNSLVKTDFSELEISGMKTTITGSQQLAQETQAKSNSEGGKE